MGYLYLITGIFLLFVSFKLMLWHLHKQQDDFDKPNKIEPYFANPVGMRNSKDVNLNETISITLFLVFVIVGSMVLSLYGVALIFGIEIKIN